MEAIGIINQLFSCDTNYYKEKSNEINFKKAYLKQMMCNQEMNLMQSNEGRSVLMSVIMDTDYAPYTIACSAWIMNLYNQVTGKTE